MILIMIHFDKKETEQFTITFKPKTIDNKLITENFITVLDIYDLIFHLSIVQTEFKQNLWTFGVTLTMYQL